MKKRNAKTLVISLALMLVMCVATALLSFSLADDTTPDSGVDASNKSTTRTNIDYIIENSHGSDKDETGRDLSPFYIVEIGSASNANNSPLKEMTLEDVTAAVKGAKQPKEQQQVYDTVRQAIERGITAITLPQLDKLFRQYHGQS